MTEYNKFSGIDIESLYTQEDLENTRARISKTLEFGYKRAGAIRLAGQEDAIRHQLARRETIVFSRSNRR